MAEQPLATDQTAQASISELKKISAVLSADQKVSEKLASDTKDTKTGTEKIATSATTFTKILSDMKGLQETAMALAERARKAALRMASKIDPSKYMKAMADKTKKFAGDLLSLLLKGGILMGLALLLKWLATQDWEKWWNEWGPKIKKKWEEFKTMFTNFYNDYKEIIDAISVISAMAAVWKAAAWLDKVASPIVKLMGWLTKIFAVSTGSIALLLVEVIGWVGKKLFHITDGTLSKLWSKIKLLFGGAGTIFKMIAIVGGWLEKGFFTIAKGSLSLLWNAIKLIFGEAGTIFKMIAKVEGWLEKGFFTIAKGSLSLLWNVIVKLFGGAGTIFKMIAKVEGWLEKGFFTIAKGSLSLLWNAIKLIFGEAGSIFKLIAKVEGWLEKGFFTIAKGSLGLLWGAIKLIFGGTGTIAALLKKVDNWATNTMFGEGGPIQKVWKLIKDIFGDHEKGLIKKLVTFFGKIEDIKMFGAGGPFHKLWTAIKGFFGLGGKLATSAGFLLTAEELVDLKFAGLHKEGALRTMWTAITGFFGDDGKIAKMLKVLKITPLPTWFDEGGKFRTFWTFIKGVFGPAGKIQDMIKVLGTVPTWFDEGGKFRTFWTFIKGVFGPAGKIAELIKTIKITPFPTWFDDTGDFKKLWTFIKGVFGPAGKIAELIKTIKITPLPNWFDEGGEFRKLWKFIKGVFGADGAIKKAVVAVADAADWFNDRHDLIQLYNWMKGLFSKTGAIGKFFTAADMGTDAARTQAATGWFGEGSKLRKMFTWFTSLFGADSALGKFVTTLSAWGTKFKEWFPDKVKTGGTKAATGIMGFFNFIGDVIGSIKKFTTGLFNNVAVKAILKFFGFVGGKALGLLGTLGKFFAPIGWIMAIIEGMMGFWEGFKSKGEHDTRTMSEKMMDGLKGAMKALVDFFVIDMIEMVESMINWAIRQINAFAGDTWGLQWMKMKEINISQSIKESMHGIIDDIMGGDVLDMTHGAAGWLKKNQAMAMESLVGKGIGTYDKEDKSFTLNSSALIKMMETMKPEEMAKMMKEIKMTENLSGVTQDWMGNYKNWEDMNAGLWKHLALKKSAAEYEALAKGYTDKMTFLNDINNTVSSGGVYVTNVSSVDQSKAIQAYTSTNTVF